MKDTAKSAWSAVGLAMNITNPLYYAKKGVTRVGKYSYQQLSDDSHSDQ